MRVFLSIGNEWREADVEKGKSIEINVVHDNLENPTNYVSENSFSLSLPKTANNNRIFDNFSILDSTIKPVGYSPNKPMDFRADSNDGEPLLQGTATISQITSSEYTLSIIGSLGTVFRKLINSGWDTKRAATDSQYSLMTDWLKKVKTFGTTPMGEETVVFRNSTNFVDKHLVFASWFINNPIFSWDDRNNGITTITHLLNTYGLNTPAYSNITETMAFIASIIGFAPTSRGKLDNFEADKWLADCQLRYTYEDAQSQSHTIVVADNFRTITNLFNKKYNLSTDEATSVELAKDGLIEAQYGEYRSYYQQPFIYVNKLWQIFKDECQRITGYTLNLDNEWFNNDADKYIKNLVYFLPALPTDDVLLHGHNLTTSTPTNITFATTTSETRYTISGLSAQVSECTTNAVEVEKNKVYQLNYNYDVELTCSQPQINSNLNFFTENFVLIDLDFMNGTTVVGSKKLLVLPITASDRVTGDLYLQAQQTAILNKIAEGYELVTSVYSSTNSRLAFGVGGQINIQCEGNYSITTRARLHLGTDYVCVSKSQAPALGSIGNVTINGKLQDAIQANVIERGRSNQEISLEKLFNDVNPFGVLLKLSKMIHLVWEIDDTNKAINVKRSATYYAGKKAQGFTNLNENIDNASIQIEPLSWGSCSIAYNFESTDKGKEYEDNYGLTYGSKKLITTNSISSEHTDLLCTSDNDTIAPCIIATEMASKVSDMIAVIPKNTIVESLPKPYNQDNCFAFRKANVSIDNSYLIKGWRDFVTITDDAKEELISGEYCWHGYDESYKVVSIPSFDISNGSLMLYFAEPRIKYNGILYGSEVYLYEKNWKKYTEEVYNAENKTIIANAFLTKNTFNQLRRNPFIQYGNIVYLLCKIEGWSEDDGLCKITMRQINNLNNITQ